MGQVGVIVHTKLRMARHAVASVRTESKLKVGVITFFALVLWGGAYVLFAEGFNWLIHFGRDYSMVASRGIGNIIMVRLFGVLAFTVFFMLIFSNVLVSFSTLYRSNEVQYLLQTPMTFRTFFLARFLECVAFSSWALAFLGSPLILAYGLTNRAPFLFYVAGLAFYVPFITMPAAIGAIITLVLVRVFPRLKIRTMALLAVLAGVLFFAYWQSHFTATRLAEDSFVPIVLEVTAQTQSHLLPSYWAARGILAAADRRYGECLFNFLLLLSNALLLLWVAAEVAQRIFHTGWSFLAGQDKTRVRPLGRGVLGRLETFLKMLPNPARSLVIKDIKLFWRDPTQWSQFVIFFGIMAIYTANLRNTSVHYEKEFWRSWIACLNVGTCTLILATLTSRFVFPLVSLEGRRFWILGLAPLTFGQIVRQKFWLSVATTASFTVGLAALSGVMLKLQPVYLVLSIYSVFITNFGLAGLAVGLGTLYPNFQEDNPARIVSGMGGTLNFVLSIVYITFIVGAQTLILQWRVLNLFSSDRAFYLALAAAVVFITSASVVCAVIPLRLGLRNLNQMEF